MAPRWSRSLPESPTAKRRLLKGADIGVPRTALPAPEENEIYYSDLVGLAVVNRQGVRLGRVANVQDFGAHPVLLRHG